MTTNKNDLIVQAPLKANNPEFWSSRLDKALEQKEKHRVYFDTELETWEKIRESHRKTIHRMISSPVKSTLITDKTRHSDLPVLEIGCKYGDTYELLSPELRKKYIGVDICPELVRMVKDSYPDEYTSNFHVVSDYGKLPFPDKFFSLCICRSVDGDIKEQLGFGEWYRIRDELFRVADRVLLLGYSEPELYRVEDSYPANSINESKVEIRDEVTGEGGFLTYRMCMDGTVELYDLYVDSSQRRKGIASRLVREVMKDTHGCIYAFSQVWNEPVRKLWLSLGFTLTRIPGFYRGVDAVMATKVVLPGEVVK